MPPPDALRGFVVRFDALSFQNDVLSPPNTTVKDEWGYLDYRGNGTQPQSEVTRLASDYIEGAKNGSRSDLRSPLALDAGARMIICEVREILAAIRLKCFGLEGLPHPLTLIVVPS